MITLIPITRRLIVSSYLNNPPTSTKSTNNIHPLTQTPQQNHPPCSPPSSPPSSPLPLPSPHAVPAPASNTSPRAAPPQTPDTPRDHWITSQTRSCRQKSCAEYARKRECWTRCSTGINAKRSVRLCLGRAGGGRGVGIVGSGVAM